MIVPKLKGGLCNQMFQIAAAYGIATEHGYEYGIDPSLEWTGGQEGCAHTKYVDNIFKNIPQVDSSAYEVYEEPTFSYAPVPAKPDMLIDGYFQCEKYFSKYQTDVKELFNFDPGITMSVDAKIKKIKKTFDTDTVVSVHVRRGEYLVPGYNHVHVALPRKHYLKAMSMFDECAYIVTSDDIQWCQDNLNIDRAAFCNTGYDYNSQIRPDFDKFVEVYDLYLASQCDHNIVSPSSFSWWGAWLGKDNKRVITGDKWFGPGGPQDYQDVICEGWEII
mgnify:FL=1